MCWILAKMLNFAVENHKKLYKIIYAYITIFEIWLWHAKKTVFKIPFSMENFYGLAK